MLSVPYFGELLHSQFDSGGVDNNFTTLPLLSWQYPFPSQTVINLEWAHGPKRANDFPFCGIIWMLCEGRDYFFSGTVSTKNPVLPELPGAILPGSLTANRKNKRQASLRHGNRVLLIVICLLYNN